MMGQSTFDFRKLEKPWRNQRSDQLFKASASAFSSLSKPAKTDIQQFEELTEALYERVSPEAKRHVAAVLASSAHAPAAIIRRLANEEPAVAAPVLAQSPCLTAGDLVAIIARHGDSHARIIRNRADLDPSIRALLSLMLKDTPEASTQRPEPAPTAAESPRLKASAADVRHALRASMAANQQSTTLPPVASQGREALAARLVPTALSGNVSFFRTALADALDVPFAMTAELVAGDGTAGLSLALRALLVPQAEAFMIAACLNPGRYLSTHTVSHFVQRYEAIALEAARAFVEDLRARGFDADQAIAPAPLRAEAANFQAAPGGLRRAG